MTTTLRKMAAATLDESSLGNLLIREKILNQSSLSEILAEFNNLKVEELLGQFLVRKRVISPEKLELLLIRQEVERGGGVESKHIQRALMLANQTSQKVSERVDEFVSSTKLAMAKAVEVK